MTVSMRIEKDSIGSINVPSNSLWGAQTQRALLNFSIGNDKMPLEIIHALAKIKKAAACVNNRLDVIDSEKSKLIVNAANDIEQGRYDNEFPLNVWQTGSGTQTNMNINEVISNIASQKTSNPLGSHIPLHPNDDVNRSQSTNDVFPAAIQISVILLIKEKLIPELNLLVNTLDQKSKEWKDIVKIGRTHLQDAVPITLGQEVSAWREQISTAINRINHSLEELFMLPLGGTAVGTGLNTPENFDELIAKEIAILTGLPFTTSKNKFAIMASHDGLVNTMSKLKILAVTLIKIFNDIRLLSCGPRAGLGELNLPVNEPGSSIMPGKVNPTQCEAMTMVCTQIIGMEAAVAIAGSGGHLQMNVYKPLIAFNLIKSIQLINDACFSSRTTMVEKIKPNIQKLQHYVDQSLMLVTALAPVIGYEKACEIAHLAHEKNISLRESALQLGYVTKKEFDEIINPFAMAKVNT